VPGITSLPVELQIALIAVFLSVSLIAGLVTFAALSRPSLAQRRLGTFKRSHEQTGVVSPAPLQTGGLDPALARWSMLLPKSARDMSMLERRLASGGYRSSWAPIVFRGLTLGLPVLFVLVALAAVGASTTTAWIVIFGSGVIGYLAPGFVLDYMARRRRREIKDGLPDVLDLLIVCLEAGSSLDQSVVKASDELAIAYPALSEELRILTTETRAGKPRIEAFKNLAQRTKVDDVRALVGMLTQTDRFGTSVAQALRTMADDMRTRRRQAAEEMAAKVGVKLVFPLVFFMFPALYVVILGPAAIQFVRVFAGQGQ
jgi:tight adherence protein C